MTDSTSATPPQGADATIAQLLRVAGIPLEHDEAALAEADRWLIDPGIDDPKLDDRLALALVTVDNDGSRDLDQALHVQRIDTGWQLHYALADAAHYVRPGTALWTAALQRGASLYAPERAIAMLPAALSEGLVSLNPGEARRALVFDLLIDAHGAIGRCEVYRARVRSRAQLTYDGLQAFIDGRASLEEARSSQPRALGTPVDERERDAITTSLHELAALGDALQAAQRRRGVMPFDRTESEIGVVGQPPRFDVTPRERLDSERWNEQLSLACNMQGASLLQALERDEPALEPIFRVHDAPGASRLTKLEKTLQTLSQRLGLNGPWQRKRKPDTSIAEWFGALPDGAPRLKQAIQRQVLRAQSGSNYEGEASRHHALAADGYARFSSPMREMVGIHTHLVLLDALGVQPAGGARDTALRDAVIASADAARSRQKALERGLQFAVIAALFERDLTSPKGNRWRDGTLLGLDSNKLHIALDGMALDVKLYREDLERDTGVDWRFDTVGALPADQRSGFMLGDGVRVRVAHYDAERGRYALQIAAMGNRATLAEKRRGALKRRARRRSALRRRAPNAPRG